MRVLVSLALSFLLIGSTARAFTYNPGDLLVMLNTQGSALTMNLGPVSALANGTANLQDTTAEWSSNQFTASAVFSAGASNGLIGGAPEASATD